MTNHALDWLCPAINAMFWGKEEAVSPSIENKQAEQDSVEMSVWI
jgi:hypothetical protein